MIVLRARNLLLMAREPNPSGPGGVGWTSDPKLAQTWPDETKAREDIQSRFPRVDAWLRGFDGGGVELMGSPSASLCQDYLAGPAKDAYECKNCQGSPRDHFEGVCTGWKGAEDGLCSACGRAFVRHPREMAKRAEEQGLRGS